MNRIVGEEVEGNFDSSTFADADVPVVAPATNDERVEFILGGPHEDEEPMDEQPRDIPTAVQAKESLRLLRTAQCTEVDCTGGYHYLVQCLNKVEQASLAPGGNTQQTQLTALLAGQKMFASLNT